MPPARKRFSVSWVTLRLLPDSGTRLTAICAIRGEDGYRTELQTIHATAPWLKRSPGRIDFLEHASF